MEKLRPVVFGPDRLPGFEAGEPSLPAVILLQEWWGVTPAVKQQALALSNRGPFRVLVPDLYKGVVGVDMEEAGHLMTSLDLHRAVHEVQQAVDHLRATGSPRVAITGGCMGGALSFAAAQYVNGLVAAAPFYGTPAREMPWIEVGKIRIPVQYHTGMLDTIPGFSDPKSAMEVTDRMRRAGCDVELHLYDNTPHSFLNALTPEGVEFLRRWRYGVPPPEQVTLAFDRLVAFLNKHLRSPNPPLPEKAEA